MKWGRCERTGAALDKPVGADRLDRDRSANNAGWSGRRGIAIVTRTNRDYPVGVVRSGLGGQAKVALDRSNWRGQGESRGCVWDPVAEPARR